MEIDKMKLRSRARKPFYFPIKKPFFIFCKWQSIRRKKKTTKNKNSGFHLEEDLQIQIISRLPLKSIIRFKCVCKRWNLLINEDPWLKELQLNHSKKQPCLLVIIEPPRYEETSFRIKRYLMANLSVEHEGELTTTVMHNLSKRESYNLIYNDIIGPVHGLFGIVENLINVVTIYNFSTREVVQECSRPTSLMEFKGKPGYDWRSTHEFQAYFFGFDSTSKKYKVICIWRLLVCQADGTILEVVACEVFTLGGSSNTWKKTEYEALPSCCFEDLSVYANNSIYWMSSVKDLQSLPFFVEELAKIDTGMNEEVLVAFDLGSEKFRVIPVPKFVPPRHSQSHLISHDGRGFKFLPLLLEVHGCFVISNRPAFDIIDMYVFDANKENAGIMNWTKERIELPTALSYAKIDMHPIQGSDYILLVCIITGRKRIKCPCVYSYNRKTKTFKEIIKSGDMGSYPYHPFMYSTFVESLSPFRE